MSFATTRQRFDAGFAVHGNRHIRDLTRMKPILPWIEHHGRQPKTADTERDRRLDQHHFVWYHSDGEVSDAWQEHLQAMMRSE